MQVRSVVLSCVFLLATSVAASAQSSNWEFGASLGRIDFDLSGSGHAAGVSGRAVRHLTPHVGLEVRGLFARPVQQSGPALLIAPDVQVQYRWNLARFSPFVGGGVGFALIKPSFRTDWDLTTSIAGGTLVRLTDRLGLIGEVRVRGFELDYVGSTGEVSFGLVWGVPRF
jgi:opacity protein-like surface antigen